MVNEVICFTRKKFFKEIKLKDERERATIQLGTTTGILH